MKPDRHIAIIGNSMIGKEIVRQARESGHRVTVISKVKRDQFDILPPDATEVVVTAQSREVAPTLSDEMYFVNVDLYRRVLADAKSKSVARAVVFSSGSVYGPGHAEPITEDTPIDLASLSSYALTKAAMEALALSMAGDFDRLVILRPFMMYGPHIKIPRLLARLPQILKNGEPIYVAEGKGIVQNPIHTSDAARFTIRNLESSGVDIFNLCGDEILSLREIARMVAERLGVTPNFVETDQKLAYFCGSTKKLRAAGLIPEIRFRKGFPDIFRFDI